MQTQQNPGALDTFYAETVADVLALLEQATIYWVTFKINKGTFVPVQVTKESIQKALASKEGHIPCRGRLDGKIFTWQSRE